eukprot:6669783-Prymnesium_polylepis.1
MIPDPRIRTLYHGSAPNANPRSEVRGVSGEAVLFLIRNSAVLPVPWPAFRKFCESWRSQLDC